MSVNRDRAGTENLRRSLWDWLSDLALNEAGKDSCIDRFIDYYGLYATSHEALDGRQALPEEVRNAARAPVAQVTAHRACIESPREKLHDPRPK